MNRNDYRRALIMLRSLKGGASGYVRLERRTLSGTLQFTLNSAPSGGELYAVLLCRRNGTWHAVKADAFGAPRYGQVGLVWSFDPRNIEGLTLEQYDMTAVAQVNGGTCELLLCGNLNGSVDADCTQIHAAVSRLFTPVRVSNPSQPPADRQSGTQLSVGQDIPAIDAPDTDARQNMSETDNSLSHAEAIDISKAVIDSSENQRDVNTADASADSVQNASVPEASEIQSERMAEESADSCGCLSSDDGNFSDGSAQTVLSNSVYTPETAEAATKDAARSSVPVEADEFDTPAAAPIESDDLDTPAQTPVGKDDFDTPAFTSVEADGFDTPASSAAAHGASDTDEFSKSAQTVLSGSVYSPEKTEAAAPDIAQNITPVEADEFDTPAQAPIESDDLDTPAQMPVESDDLDTPAQTPIESDDLDTPAQPPVEKDDFDTPALTPIEADEFDTPASSDTSYSASDENGFSESAQTVLSDSVYSPEKAEASAINAAPQDSVPVEADEFDTPAQSPIQSDDLDTPAQAPIESDDFDTPAAESADQRNLSTPAKASSIEQELSVEEGSSRKSEGEAVPLPSAGQQLSLTDPDAAWHRSIEPLHRLFFSQEAVVPFEAAGYVFIRAPLYGVENTASCLVGLYCEDGVPARVCYAIPADYTAEPPAGLEGYVWRGSRTRGYWVTCEAVPAAQ